MAIRVVVALLGPQAFVTRGDHGDASAREERCEEIAGASIAHGLERRIGALRAVVEGAVVLGAIAAVLAVSEVVLVVVRREVSEREAIVGGHEVDRRERRAHRPTLG